MNDNTSPDQNSTEEKQDLPEPSEDKPLEVSAVAVGALPKTEEEKEIIITKKFEDWCTLFLDKNNKTTYGNKTQSAIMAYSLDPIKQYHSAGVIGYENFKKLKSVASAYADSKGITAGQMIDVAWAKVFDSKNGGGIDWWDRVAEITGLREPKGTPLVVQNNNTQVNNYELGSTEVRDFNKDFQQFLEADKA